MASGPRYYRVARRPRGPAVRALDRVDAHPDQVGLRDGRPEDLVGPPLAGVALDEEPREGVEEREREPEQLGDVSDGRLRDGHGGAQGADLEAREESPDGTPGDCLAHEGV